MRRFNLRVRLPGFITALFKEATWRMDKTRQVVYLTFDDGPIPEVTPWVLDLLRKENIRATFFCVGENVSRYPEVYQQILDDGHSVGNHTYNHWQGLKKSNREYFRNIEKAREYIDSDLFRPPHGWLRRSQYFFLKRKYRIVMWDVISCDYDRGLKPEKVFRNIADFVRSGSIITFHDSLKAQRNLEEVLPKSIRWMKEQGYHFEAIPYKKVNE
ncbi:MAG: polysaccharide deacetylase family protein [Prolixibacteraceae bacterium]|nr:polysaccharide deacetylase family protein [Prolixibacteraceae bacterium]